MEETLLLLNAILVQSHFLMTAMDSICKLHKKETNDFWLSYIIPLEKKNKLLGKNYWSREKQESIVFIIFNSPFRSLDLTAITMQFLWCWF